MDVAEAMIKHIIRTVLEQVPRRDQLLQLLRGQGLKERLEHVASSDFGRVSYTEAVEILKKHNDQFDFKVTGAPTSRRSMSVPDRAGVQAPVFVTDYPPRSRPFYMRMNDDGKTVAAADCLVPASARSSAAASARSGWRCWRAHPELGMNPEDYWWYCDLRRYGSCKHAGFGLGFERMVMYLTGVSNIRDVELHPRTVGNAEF